MQLVIEKAAHLPRLVAELAALAALVDETATGDSVARFTLETDDDASSVVIGLPDTLSAAARDEVQAVIDAHDPTPPGATKTPAQQAITDLEAATTVAEVTQALIAYLTAAP